MMKGEKRLALIPANKGPILLVEDQEVGAALRLPVVVLDKRLATHHHAERIDHQGILGQDNIVFGHPKAMHVGRLLGGNRA